MRGIIWYYTSKEMGLQRLEQLINEYRRIRIEVIHRTQTEVTFDNGDLWKVVPADDRGRGQACNVGLIERGTPEDAIHTRIMPCIKTIPTAHIIIIKKG